MRPEHWRIVQAILQQQVPQYGVWAIGSRVSGKARRYSDLDLVILTDEPLPLDASAMLKEAFSESDLPWKVDVLDWATLTRSFRDIVQLDKIIIQ